jgi:Ca2+-binding RTX toxin-like protein
VSLVAGATNTGGDAQGDVLGNIENLEGSFFRDTLTGNAGNNVLDGGAGNDTLIGNGGVDTYKIGRGSGQDRMVNAASGAGARGELDIGADVATNQIWLQQSGNDLLVKVMGTQDQAIIVGWYGADSSAQLQKVVTSNGNTLDTQLNQLVQAMATYSANNPGFDPTTAAQAPNDPALQNAIATSWHPS